MGSYTDVKNLIISNIKANGQREITGPILQDVLLNMLENSSRVEEITYSDLKALRDGAKLTPSRLYRITDYITTTVQSNTKSARHPFDVIVLALSESELLEQAWAIQHEGDEYFANSNLSDWELWYCLDNDTTRFAWADSTNGKGVIYRMIDEFNNDIPYDFKNIQFKHPKDTTTYPYYYYTFASSNVENNTDYSISIANNCYSNVIKEYITSGKRTLNQIIFIGINCYFNSFSSNCYNNTLGTNCYYNSFGFRCYNNTLGANCYSNSFGNTCIYNSLYSNCDHNSFDSNCGSNSLGSNCANNSFGPNCDNNSFKSQCNNNILGPRCLTNSFNIQCNNNTLGPNCIKTSLGSGCLNNSLGSNCDHNSFGSSCISNSLGSSCVNNSLGSGCVNNFFGQQCHNNTLGPKCINNYFVSYCDSNSFGSGCHDNSFKSDCYNNTFCSYCYYNLFGTGCDNNSFASYDNNITFSYDCRNNSFGSNCSYIKFASDKDTTTKYNYYQNNHFGDRCQYILFKGAETASASAQVQNYKFAQGLQGKYDAYLVIDGERSRSYETYISKDSDGTIKESVIADNTNNISNLTTNLSNEISARTQADTELQTQINSKQEALTLTVKDNGNIVLANIQGQSKEFMPATPSGDPMHYAYVAAGAEYNATNEDIIKDAPWADLVDDDYEGEYGKTVLHKAGCWYLNGLGDLTNEDIREIYLTTGSFINTNYINYYLRKSTIKTNFPNRTNVYSDNSSTILNIELARASRLKVIKFFTSPFYNTGQLYYCYNTFSIACLDIQNMEGVNKSNALQFKYLMNIQYMYLQNIKTSLDISDSAKLSCKSVLYMINNEVATSPITITLHKIVYDRCMTKAEILAALEAHPNVSLASA